MIDRRRNLREAMNVPFWHTSPGGLDPMSIQAPLAQRDQPVPERRQAIELVEQLHSLATLLLANVKRQSRW